MVFFLRTDTSSYKKDTIIVGKMSSTNNLVFFFGKIWKVKPDPIAYYNIISVYYYYYNLLLLK